MINGDGDWSEEELRERGIVAVWEVRGKANRDDSRVAFHEEGTWRWLRDYDHDAFDASGSRVSDPVDFKNNHTVEKVYDGKKGEPSWLEDNWFWHGKGAPSFDNPPEDEKDADHCDHFEGLPIAIWNEGTKKFEHIVQAYDTRLYGQTPDAQIEDLRKKIIKRAQLWLRDVPLCPFTNQLVEIAGSTVPMMVKGKSDDRQDYTGEVTAVLICRECNSK